MMTHPPVLKENKHVFGWDDSIYQTATLYVPLGCKDVYSNKTGWSKFVNIQEKDFSAGAPEDLNGDGKVDAQDIQSVINACAGNDADTKFDVNGDGKVDALDIQQVINTAAREWLPSSPVNKKKNCISRTWGDTQQVMQFFLHLNQHLILYNNGLRRIAGIVRWQRIAWVEVTVKREV